MSSKHSTMRGFTLVELIIIIVAIGILSAVAIPKYIDASKDAKLGALKGAANALTSAAAQNYAVKLTGTTNFVGVGSCSAVTSLAQVPANMVVTETSPASPPSSGVLGTCVINYTSTAGALPTGYTFKVMGA